MKAIAIIIGLILVPLTVRSQEFTGQWNGTLEVQGIKLRLVFHVDLKDGEYQSTIDSPDQNAFGIAVTTTLFNNPDVKFDMPAIGAAFTGKWSDGQIVGSWAQSGQTFALVLTKSDD